MHVIRLRGPWQYEPLARTVLLADGTTRAEPGELPPAGDVQMPGDWGDSLGADFRGRVRYSRRFNRPTGLEPGDLVFITVDDVDAFGAASLNDHPLGAMRLGEGPFRFDVTELLERYNRLMIEVELPRTASDSPPLPRGEREGLPGGLIGEVRLEIEAAEGDVVRSKRSR